MIIGYTHGRYQPLHKGHFALFLRILQKYDQLWIGIANPERKLPLNIDSLGVAVKASVLKARAPENNPFSYAERQEMLLQSFIHEGIDLSRIRVLPHYGFYDAADGEEFMPPIEETVIVLSPKDAHHDAKIRFYEKRGWKIKLEPPVPGISGKDFDAAWPNGNWRELVPKGAVEIIERKLKG